MTEGRFDLCADETKLPLLCIVCLRLMGSGDFHAPWDVREFIS